MVDESGPATSESSALRAQLRARLPHVCGPLRILAEQALGAEAPIDYLGLTPEGRLVAVLVGDARSDLELVGLALAQRAWLERRRRDLAQLVPGVRADLAVRVVLLLPELGPAARLALESIAGPELVCARVVRPAGSSGTELMLDLPRVLPTAGARQPSPTRAGAPRTESPSLPEAPRARFRSRLTDADLGLEGDEPA